MPAPDTPPPAADPPVRIRLADRCSAAGLVRRAVLLAAAALLAACTLPIAQAPGGAAPLPPVAGTLPAPDPAQPRVFVNEFGRVVVDQEPIYVDSRSPKPIVFTLTGPDLRFANEGVVIEGEVTGTEPAVGREGKPASFTTRLDKRQTAIQCKRESDVRVVCAVVGAKPGSSYLYTIRVERRGVPLPPLDPVIWVM